MRDRNTPWIQTFSGVHFHPTDPRADEILIEDIAHSLAHQHRFSGHTKLPWSVASHSMLVAEILAAQGEKSPDVLLTGLLHDASEAYVVDVPSPIKHLPGMAFYRELEDNIQKAIAEKYSLPYPWPKSIHEADMSALAMEARDLMGSLEGWKLVPAEHFMLPKPLVHYPAGKVEGLFLDLFAKFQRQRLGDDWVFSETTQVPVLVPPTTPAPAPEPADPAVEVAAPAPPPPGPALPKSEEALMKMLELARQKIGKGGTPS